MSPRAPLARSLSPAYYDLEQPGDRIRLDLQWTEALARNQAIVLDEAHTWPELFPRLRGAIDAERSRNGRFLILGSVSPALMREVSESLAGRLAIIELTPFTAAELPDVPLQDLWLRGGFPDGGILASDRFPQWQLDYLTLLTQRDLPVWGLPARPPVTERLLRMLAALHGQIWNASQVGAGLGLSYHTVNTYLDYLEGAFLVRRLPPWLPNRKKRVIRSPRVYWRDSGLLHALGGVGSIDELLHQPWVGASWDGFVIHQILDVLAARGERVEPYYFRTADGYEVDLVFKLGPEVWAIEAKLTSEPSEQEFHRLDRAAEMIGAGRRYLVAQVPEPVGSGGRGVAGVRRLLDALAPGAQKSPISASLPWMLRVPWPRVGASSSAPYDTSGPTPDASPQALAVS